MLDKHFKIIFPTTKIKKGKINHVNNWKFATSPCTYATPSDYNQPTKQTIATEYK